MGGTWDMQCRSSVARPTTGGVRVGHARTYAQTEEIDPKAFNSDGGSMKYLYHVFHFLYGRATPCKHGKDVRDCCHSNRVRNKKHTKSVDMTRETCTQGPGRALPPALRVVRSHARSSGKTSWEFSSESFHPRTPEHTRTEHRLNEPRHPDTATHDETSATESLESRVIPEVSMRIHFGMFVCKVGECHDS